ncbi:retrovirus-related pol polyprotein from transposon TNT 1-94 [Tanacetum coccineum]
MSQDVMICVMNSTAVFDDVNVKMQSSESCVKCLDLDVELLNKQNAYYDLSKSYSQLEKYCISLELTMQLNQEIFQKDLLSNNQNAHEISEYFENNDLKAQLQAKDTPSCKLKEHIKSHGVSKLLSVNERLHKEIEHLKKIYKDQFDSIKKTSALSKEQCDSLNAQLNSKSMENADLKGQIQEKVFVTIALQKELRKLKGKNVIDNAATITNATSIALGMFKLDLDPLAPRLLKNRDAHIDYLKYTQDQADILWGIVEQAKAKQPLDNALDISFKKVRFSKPLTSLSNIHKQVESSKTSDSNTPVLPSIGLKSSTSASRSQPTGNKKNDRILQTPSNNMKNKVEVQRRRVKSKSNKKNRAKDPICDANVKHTMLNANSELICVNINNSVKTSQQHNIWKPTGKVFTEVGYKWIPTGRLFTLVGNSCPLTRINSTKVVPIKETISHSVEIKKPEIKVYSRRPKQVKSVGSSKKAMIVESNIANNSEPNHLWGSNATNVPSSSSRVNDSKYLGVVRFENGQIAKIMGYGDYQLGNLAKDGFARGIPKLKFQKDHLCSACALGKSKKSSHQPKAKDTNQEKLYLLHMDLCGLIHVESINGEKYILVIVDDYSRFTWVKFMRSKDEAPDAIIKCIKNIQVRLNGTVHNVRTNNGTEFVNQTLREFYENVGITHQTFVARAPQQNSLMHDKKLDLSFLHVFGSLCYPTNDSEDLGKLNAKADIGIFVGYAPAKKAFRIYNRRTQKIMETIHVTFDELTAMASEQFSSGPGHKLMTPATSSSGLVPNPIPQQPINLPTRNDRLFQPMFDEYFNTLSSVVSLVLVAAAPRAIDIAGLPSSTTIDQDAPSSTNQQQQSSIISQGVEEPILNTHFDDPCHEPLHDVSTSQKSSSNV